ncbi:histidine phosphatase family protein [Kitasatospora sp. NPDC089509]|uniref:histidine phosphatase family protein n=1 Tax=Kitasatospora sp. NPDC089509 TaxID=3364079 RepID=UPI003820D898
MTTIIFIRHGQTAHNVDLVITSGAPGGPLTPEGERQVAELANELRATAAQPVEAVYSSPLRRARQSATIVAAPWGLAPIEREELRECSVGELEGRSGPEAFARFDSTWDHWYHDEHPDLDYALGPGGESGRQALDRVRAVVRDIITAHPDGTVAVVGHGTVLQLALTWLSDNLRPSFGHRRWIPNAGTVVVAASADGIRCLEWSGQPVSAVTSGEVA